MLWTAAFGKPGGNAARPLVEDVRLDEREPRGLVGRERGAEARLAMEHVAQEVALGLHKDERDAAAREEERRAARGGRRARGAAHVGGHVRGELARVERAAVVRAVRARDEGDEHALHGDAAPATEGRDGRERPPPVPAHDVRRQRDIWVHLAWN